TGRLATLRPSASLTGYANTPRAPGAGKRVKPRPRGSGSGFNLLEVVHDVPGEGLQLIGHLLNALGRLLVIDVDVRLQLAQLLLQPFGVLRRCQQQLAREVGVAGLLARLERLPGLLHPPLVQLLRGHRRPLVVDELARLAMLVALALPDLAHLLDALAEL